MIMVCKGVSSTHEYLFKFNLYREFNSEDFDYYGINDETLCPLCKLDHDDEEGIDGRYEAGSYFIKCEQREIEIVA